MVNDEAGHDKVRAVAFTIQDKVYVGTTNESHVTLYLRLLHEILVPAHTLDAWTSDDKNNGFVTVKGEFISRDEAFERFGAARSQDLQAQGFLQTER